MKIFSTLKPESVLNPHPQEDFFVISKKYPIFVVADGVSLKSDSNDYPKTSGAGEAAKIFCETVVAAAEKRYRNFEENDLKEIFEIGNKAVLGYNVSQGMTGPESGHPTINYWDKDLFSATASFLLIKENKAYWFSLCDSGVALFDKSGRRLFSSPDGWEICKKYLPQNWNKLNEKESVITRHKDYRNAVDLTGKLTGYGAVNGESAATLYLNAGVLDVNLGDFAIVYTDGFENYFKLPEFIDLFKLWPTDLQKQVEDLITKKSKEDHSKYGLEKTLIAVSN